MRLNPLPYTLICSGDKTVEMRLYDEKRRGISAGDIIKFTNTESSESITVTVKKMSVYSDFCELYSHYAPREIGYAIGEAANPDDMLAYYSKEDVEKYGVVAIEVERATQ